MTVGSVRVEVVRDRSRTPPALRLVGGGSDQLRPVNAPRDMREFLTGLFLDMKGLAVEQFWIVMLDTRNQYLAHHLVAQGSLNASIVHPREVFRAAVVAGAANIVLVHNHPSGDPTPSDDDLTLTQRLHQVGEMLGIGVLDHLIWGDKQFSFREAGML